MTGALPTIPQRDLLPLFTSLLRASVILMPNAATEDENTTDVKSTSAKEKTTSSSSGCCELRAFIETFTTAPANPCRDNEVSQVGNDSSKFRFLCPALSLHHDTTSSHRRSGKEASRKEAAEEHARSLLARPFRFVETVEQAEANTQPSEQSDAENEHRGFVTVSCPPSTVKGEEGCGSSSIYEHVPATILQNIVSSFAVLVDSRLHAYAVFLTRHAVAISRSSKAPSCHELSDDDDEDNQAKTNNERIHNIKQKLEMILQLGNQLTVDAMALCFEVVESNEEESPRTGPIKEMSNRSTSQILLRLAIDFRIPLGNTIPSTDKNFSITITTPGVIEGSFSEIDAARLESIQIMVDTKHLLDCMIHEASRVVSIVVDVARSLLQSPTTSRTESVDDEVRHSVEENVNKEQGTLNDNPSPPKQHLHRTSSFLAMPPPLPRNVGNNNIDGDEASTDLEENPVALQHKKAAFHLGLDLLSEVAEAERLRVVTPDMSSLSPNPSSVVIPTLKLEAPVGLTLDDDEDNEDDDDVTSTNTDVLLLDDVSYLSPDQCADIIDTCLFATDNIPFFGSRSLEQDLPAAKRAKLF